MCSMSQVTQERKTYTAHTFKHLFILSLILHADFPYCEWHYNSGFSSLVFPIICDILVILLNNLDSPELAAVFQFFLALFLESHPSVVRLYIEHQGVPSRDKLMSPLGCVSCQATAQTSGRKR